MKALILLMILLPLSSDAKEASKDCLSEEKVSRILGRYSISLDAKFDHCDPKNHVYQVVEALIFIHELHLDGPRAPAPYNQEIIGYSWEQRLLSNTPIMGWGSRANCVGAGAYTLPYNQNRRHMFWCSSGFNTENFTNSQLSLVSTLLHESRHMDAIDRGGYSHVSCHKQANACDPSAGYRGAYAAGMEAMAKVGISATNVHPTLSYFARTLAYVAATDKFVIAAEPETKAQSVVLLIEMGTGRRLIFNYRFNKYVLKYLPPGRVFELSGLNMFLAPKNLMDAGRGFPNYRLDQEFNLDDGDMDYSKLYTVQLYTNASPAERNTLGDTTSIKSTEYKIDLSIWGNRIRAGIKERRKGVQTELKSEISLPRGTPVTFRPEQEEEGVDIVNDQDQLFRVTFDTETHNLTIHEVPNRYPGFTKIAKVRVREAQEAWDKRQEKRNFKDDRRDPAPQNSTITYLLSKDGRVFQDSPSGPVPVPSLINQQFDWMSREFRYHPELPDDLQSNR